MDDITKNLLDQQEGEIDDNLNYYKFKQILEVDFIPSAIEAFWDILYIDDDHEGIMNRIKSRLGKMDEGEAQYIYDTWEHVTDRLTTQS